MNEIYQSALLIDDLKKTYNGKLEALKGVSLEVKAGDFFAVLGPNGAGKSTMIGIISSLVQKTSGQVKVFGVDVDENFSKAKKFLGVVPQEFNFNLFEKVEDIVMQQAGYYGLPLDYAKAQTEKYLTKLSLWDKRHSTARSLSGGMKRRLMIARALVHEPKLLILDEPTAGVDIELRRSMWEFLKEMNEAGTTIILTTHYLEEAESLCRHVAIIDKGQLIQNTSVKNLLQQLNKETFVFDTLDDLPDDFSSKIFQIRRTDKHSFEVDVEKGQHLNDLFKELTKLKISVTSMRNKANRLEEMFVAMISNSAEENTTDKKLTKAKKDDKVNKEKKKGAAK